MNILFNATVDLVAIVSELEELWLVSFERKFFTETALYRFEGLNLLIDMFDEHGLDNDMGINFESYRYEMDIYPVKKLEGYKDLCRSLALFLANQLHGTLGYSCIVVEDLQLQLLILE